MYKTGLALLNEGFELDPEEATALWEGGLPIQLRGKPDKLRRSADGQWLIRRGTYKYRFEDNPPRYELLFPTHGDAAIWAEGELTRLQDLGLNILSRGMAPSPDDEDLIIVTPWLEVRDPCTNAEFNAHIGPVLNRYFAGAAVGSLIMSDLRLLQQYSRLESGELPLHDLEPFAAPANISNTRSLTIPGQT